jgi:hypothetical protein
VAARGWPAGLILISHERRKRRKRRNDKESFAKRNEKLSRERPQVIEIISGAKSMSSRNRVFQKLDRRFCSPICYFPPRRPFGASRCEAAG